MSQNATNLLGHLYRAAIDAVDSKALVERAISVEGDHLSVLGERVRSLGEIQTISVLAFGKAAAGMSAGLEAGLSDKWLEKIVFGRGNIPAGCKRELRKIELREVRPPGVNQATDAVLESTADMLDFAETVDSGDLVFVLTSGGGSALADVLHPEITLEMLAQTTNFIQNNAGNITQLNIVRGQLSLFKAGNLARAFAKAGRLCNLILSDVLGDPLPVIASGPTVECVTTPQMALEVLSSLGDGLEDPGLPSEVVAFLRKRAEAMQEAKPFPQNVRNFVIGNNQTAVDAMAETAERLGCRQVINLGTNVAELTEKIEAHVVGANLARLSHAILSSGQHEGANVQFPLAIVSGGEPVVQLNPSDPRERERLGLRGGRNLSVALSFGIEMARHGVGPFKKVSMFSLGTDGEDGPSDAAGSYMNSEVFSRMQGVRLSEHLEQGNEEPVLRQGNGLIKTGPTHTNACDVRAIVLDPNNELKVEAPSG